MSNFNAEIFDPGLLQGRSSQGRSSGVGGGAGGKAGKVGASEKLGNENDDGDDYESDESDTEGENGQKLLSRGAARHGKNISSIHTNTNTHINATNTNVVRLSASSAHNSHASLSIIPSLPAANQPLKSSNSLKRYYLCAPSYICDHLWEMGICSLCSMNGGSVERY